MPLEINLATSVEYKNKEWERCVYLTNGEGEINGEKIDWCLRCVDGQLAILRPFQ